MNEHDQNEEDIFADIVGIVVRCALCEGKGYYEGATCPHCTGQGQRRYGRGTAGYNRYLTLAYTDVRIAEMRDALNNMQEEYRELMARDGALQSGHDGH